MNDLPSYCFCRHTKMQKPNSISLHPFIPSLMCIVSQCGSTVGSGDSSPLRSPSFVHRRKRTLLAPPRDRNIISRVGRRNNANVSLSSTDLSCANSVETRACAPERRSRAFYADINCVIGQSPPNILKAKRWLRTSHSYVIRRKIVRP